MNNLANQKDPNEFAVLLDGDSFGPKIVFVGDDVRFLMPDSTSTTQMATVLEIPDRSSVVIQAKGGGLLSEGTKKTIYRDRILVVFSKFK